MKQMGIMQVLAAAVVVLLAAAPGLAITTPPTWRPPELVATGVVTPSHLSSERMMATDHHGSYGIAYASDADGFAHYA